VRNPFTDTAVVSAINTASRTIAAAVHAAADANEKYLAILIRQQEQIMTNQEQLDQRLAVLAQNISDAIDALKNQPGAETLDFTQLDQLNAELDAATPNPDDQPPTA
jgi:uncharacterized iron-regulated protein